jgi:hypothetical protein
MIVGRLGLLMAVGGALVAANIPYTGRSSYGQITDQSTIKTVPCGGVSSDCQGESFPSTNSSDTVFAYQVIGLSKFTLEIQSTDGTLDAGANVPFGAFITDAPPMEGEPPEVNFYGATPGPDDSYTCSATADLPSDFGCSVSSQGFDIVFTVTDGNANCHDPKGNCGFVFFVGETSDIQPTATLSPEPSSFGLAAAGLAIAGLQLVSVRRRRRPKDANF